MKRIELIIEKSEDNLLWGRVSYNDSLITDTGETVQELENKIKALLKDFEGVNPDQVVFITRYDIYVLFKKFNFLKISSIAEHAGINAGLLRQYASGVKHPGKEQAKKIENALHKLASYLQEASIYTN